MLDLERLKREAELEGHDPWKATVAALEDLNARVSALEGAGAEDSGEESGKRRGKKDK